jgi:hypothetical protein
MIDVGRSDGVDRMTELSEQIRLMWVQHDPAKTSLKDAPDPADDETEWAEFRVSASVERHPSVSFRACLCKV